MTLLSKQNMIRLTRPERQIYSGVGLLCSKDLTKMTLHAISFQMGLPVQSLQRQASKPNPERIDLSALCRHIWFFTRYYEKEITPGNVLVLVEGGREDLGSRMVMDLLMTAPHKTVFAPRSQDKQLLRIRAADWIEESGRSVMEVCLLAGLPYATGLRFMHHQWMDRVEVNTLERFAAAFSTIFRRPFTVDDLIEFPPSERDAS